MAKLIFVITYKVFNIVSTILFKVIASPIY